MLGLIAMGTVTMIPDAGSPDDLRQASCGFLWKNAAC